MTLIILAGLFLRLFRLSFQGIWFDEANTWLVASRGVLELWKDQVLNFYPPPYFNFMHYWIKIMGREAFALRLPSAIFGVLSIPLVYFVGKKMFDKRTALISSLLLAFSSPHIYYSQEARVYVILAAAALLSGFCFFRMLSKENNKTSAIYIISTLFCLYLHNYAIFIWLTQLLYLFFKGQLKKFRMLMAQMIILFLYFPRIIVFSQQIFMDMDAYIMKPHLSDLLRTLAHLVIMSRNMPVFPLIALIVILNIILFVFLYLFAARKIKEARAKFSFSLCSWHIIVPIGASFLLSFIKPIYDPGRYDFLVYLFVILVIGKGIASLNKKMWRGIVITVILSSSLLCLYDYYYIYRKSNNIVLNDFIKREVASDDVMVFTNLAVLTYHYYFGRDAHKYVFAFPEGDDLACHPKEVIQGNEAFTKNELKKIIRKIIPLVNNKRRLFLFYNTGMKIDRELYEDLKGLLYLEREISFHERPFDKFEIMKAAIFTVRHE
jgi:uncharacterized membrane protein